MPHTEQYHQIKIVQYDIVATIIIVAIVVIVAVKLFQKIANWFYDKQQKRSDCHD